jgi:hypothetical protein
MSYVQTPVPPPKKEGKGGKRIITSQQTYELLIYLMIPLS